MSAEVLDSLEVLDDLDGISGVSGVSGVSGIASHDGPDGPDGSETVPGAPPVDTRSAWERTLDDLEGALDAAQALVAPGFLLEAPAAPQDWWVPPADLGPIPPGLADRAVQILDRQLELVSRVDEAAQAARAHLRAVGSMRTNDTSASVYIDAVG